MLTWEKKRECTETNCRIFFCAHILRSKDHETLGTPFVTLLCTPLPTFLGYHTKMITRLTVGIWVGPLHFTAAANFGFQSCFSWHSTSKSVFHMWSYIFKKCLSHGNYIIELTSCIDALKACVCVCVCVCVYK